MNPPVSAAPLSARIEETAHSLRTALAPLLEELCGAPLRPSRLIQRLGIDKSLASRLTRALRAGSTGELLHLIPSPSGLRSVLDRAAEKSADPGRLASAEDCVVRFQELLDGLPGGRAALDASLSRSHPELRETRERSSRQAAFKAMSYLLGYYCESLATALILEPSPDGSQVDGVEVHQRVGLRRLRPETPLAIMSFSFDQKSRGLENEPWVETLDGTSASADPSHFVLPELCSQPTPRLETHEIGEQTVFVLGDRDPSLEAPITLTSGCRFRNCWPRDLKEASSHASRQYLLHLPSKVLVRDIFIRDDLYVGAIPEILHELPKSPIGPGRPRGVAGKISTLDIATSIEQLRPGLDGAATGLIPGYRDTLLKAFQRSGLDPNRFRGYRCTLAYPVPLVTMSWWLRPHDELGNS